MTRSRLKSQTLRADELYLKIRGNMEYLFALMDDETRFWIAQEVVDAKYSSNQAALSASKGDSGKETRDNHN